MTLTSIYFFCFVILTLFAYFTVPKRHQWIVLLIASYIFYAFSGIKHIAFLLFVTIVTFFTGIFLERAKGKKQKKRILRITLVILFGMLLFLKYYDFFALIKVNIILPLGISFYIFQSVGYVIDVYRGKYDPEHNIFKYALFVSFFPQIIQGPISQYDQLAHQLYDTHDLDFDELKYGLQLMLWGYFKKLIIADRAAVIVNTVFDNYANYPGSISAVAVFFYCIQIYCDFSGGIDIIRGIAQTMGIDMIENFKRPYYATSLADFWRRWHISLGNWMKKYLFYPLSLSKPFLNMGKKTRKIFKGRLGKMLPTSIATFIVFFCIGIWHGSSLKYIAFGFWNGGIIFLSLLLEPFFNRMLEKCHINPDSFWWRIFRILRTTFLVFIGRYFTRGATCMTALRMLKHTFCRFGATAIVDGTVLSLGLDKIDFVLIFLGGLVVLVLGYFQETGVEIRKALEKKSGIVQWLVLMAGLIVLVYFGIYREGYISSEFIYQQF